MKQSAKHHARTLLWIEGNQVNNQEEKDMLLQEAAGRIGDAHGELKEWESENAVELADLANLSEQWCSAWAWGDDDKLTKDTYEEMMNRAAEIAQMTRAK
jgi:hypothetical protein